MSEMEDNSEPDRLYIDEFPKGSVSVDDESLLNHNEDQTPSPCVPAYSPPPYSATSHATLPSTLNSSNIFRPFSPSFQSPMISQRPDHWDYQSPHPYTQYSYVHGLPSLPHDTSNGFLPLPIPVMDFSTFNWKPNRFGGLGYSSSFNAPSTPMLPNTALTYSDSFTSVPQIGQRKTTQDSNKPTSRELQSDRHEKPEEPISSYQYKRHSKPPYTFCGLIITVIENSPEKQLTLSQINKELYEMFDCFKGSYQGWKASVRHNLTNSHCFQKGDICQKNYRKNIHYWNVDLSKVPNGAFCLQRTYDGTTDNFKDHIHEELGLPPIQLPYIRYGYDCRCKSILLPRLLTPVNVGQKRKREENRTITPMASGKKLLRLPVVDECSLPGESPEVYRSRDTLNSSISLDWQCASFNLTPPVKQEKLTEAGTRTKDGLAHAHCEPDIQFRSISDFILKTEGNEGMTAAVENLSFLCGDKNKSPGK